MSIEKLRQTLKDKKVIFGFDRTLKGLKRGEISLVFLSSNCTSEMKEEIKSFGVEMIELKEDSDEVAMICKRQHPIAVISVLK